MQAWLPKKRLKASMRGLGSAIHGFAQFWNAGPNRFLEL
jgi:hypothetical protein